MHSTDIHDTGHIADTPCDAIRAELAAAALGDGALDAQTRAHLLTCPGCARALADYLRLAQRLQAAPGDQPAPPPALRDRIIAAVAEPAASAAPTRTRPYRRWAALAGAIALALALLGWNVSLQQQLAQRNTQLANSRAGWQALVVMMNSPQVRVSRISTGAVRGSFWGVPDTSVACLMIEDLPALPPGKVYQVWLAGPGGWVSAGTFEPRSSNVWFMLRPEAPLSSFSAVAVSIAPAGGAAAPGDAPVLTGPLDPISG